MSLPALIIDAVRNIIIESNVMKMERLTPVLQFCDLNCYLSLALLKFTPLLPHLSGPKCNFPALNPEVLPWDTLGRLQG